MSYELNRPDFVLILVEFLGLPTENVKYILPRVIGFESGSKRVSSKVRPGLLGIFL